MHNAGLASIAEFTTVILVSLTRLKKEYFYGCHCTPIYEAPWSLYAGLQLSCQPNAGTVIISAICFANVVSLLRLYALKSFMGISYQCFFCYQFPFYIVSGLFCG